MIKYRFDSNKIHVEFINYSIDSLAFDLFSLNQMLIEDMVKNNYDELNANEKKELLTNITKILGYMLISE